MEYPSDGRRPPPPESVVKFRTVVTQTQPDTSDVADGGSAYSSNVNRCQSDSPSSSYPIIIGGSDSRPSSRCSSGGAGVENVSPELPVGSKFSSSPKPNKSYQFVREPPDGAEKVPLQDNEER